MKIDQLPLKFVKINQQVSQQTFIISNDAKKKVKKFSILKSISKQLSHSLNLSVYKSIAKWPIKSELNHTM